MGVDQLGGKWEIASNVLAPLTPLTIILYSTVHV